MSDLAHTVLSTSSAATPMEATDSHARPLPCKDNEFESVLTSGFNSLRFPGNLESRYQQDRSVEHLKLIRRSGLWMLLLSGAMLMTDWLMVRDQFDHARQLRLLFYTPVCLLCFLCVHRLERACREWAMAAMGLLAALITVFLCMNSNDELAPAYLVVLCLVQLINGGLMQLPFWKTVKVDAAILFMFSYAALNFENPPVVVLVAALLVMLSVTVFTLYGSYWLEHKDRTNWLMLKHEHQLQSQLQMANRTLDHLSRFDPLTNLANRRHFDEALQQTWARCAHEGGELALMMIDIDHFKAYNDEHGHPAGDACLKAVAEVLQECLRQPKDLVARFGGEEFIALLSHSGMRSALAVAERVRAAVASCEMPVTVSIGVATARLDSQNGSSADLIAAADQALYRAKADGRNTVRAAQELATLDTSRAKHHEPVSPEILSSPSIQAESSELARAQSLIDRKYSALRFPPSLEQQFLSDGAPARLRYMVLSGVLSLVVFNGFLLADYLIAPDVFDLALKIRLGCFTPMAMALLMMGWFARDWTLRTLPPSALEGLVLTSGILAAVCVAYILSVTRSPTGQYYHVGLLVIIVYACIVQRLRFWYAMLCAVAVFAIHICGVLMVPAFNGRLITPSISLVGATVIFSLMANYAMERDERRRYLLIMRQKRLLQDLDDAHRRLQNLAKVDVLTGVYNRRYLEEHLSQAWQRGRHEQGDVAVIMLDVDHFKKYNDHYGHPAGDRCLVRVAEAMQACLRQPGDMVARYGGEEFIAVLLRTDADLARQAAERIRLAVQALKIPHAGSDTALSVTVSVGVASTRPALRRSEADLISAADAALYQAKHGGRNRVALAPAMQHHGSSRLA